MDCTDTAKANAVTTQTFPYRYTVKGHVLIFQQVSCRRLELLTCRCVHFPSHIELDVMILKQKSSRQDYPNCETTIYSRNRTSVAIWVLEVNMVSERGGKDGMDAICLRKSVHGGSGGRMPSLEAKAKTERLTLCLVGYGKLDGSYVEH